MSTTKRKMLDTSVIPKRLNEFRESNQGEFKTCDAKAYAEYVAQDVSFRWNAHATYVILFIVGEWIIAMSGYRQAFISCFSTTGTSYRITYAS